MHRITPCLIALLAITSFAADTPPASQPKPRTLAQVAASYPAPLSNAATPLQRDENKRQKEEWNTKNAGTPLADTLLFSSAAPSKDAQKPAITITLRPKHDPKATRRFWVIFSVADTAENRKTWTAVKFEAPVKVTGKIASVAAEELHDTKVNEAYGNIAVHLGDATATPKP